MSTQTLPPEPDFPDVEPIEPIEQDTEDVGYLDNDKTWQEQHPPAKPEILKGRKYAADFSAALRTILRGCGFEDSDIATAMVIIDAGRRADEESSPSSIRRFPCAAWLFELYRRRESFKGLDIEEIDKRKASYSRQWGRLWGSLHDKQCRVHLGFFIKEDPEQRRDKKHNPCIYTDRLTDVVNEVITRARKLPGFKKYAIPCFEQAASEVLKEFRAEYPKYAPDWTEPEPLDEPEEEKADEKPDYEKLVGKIHRVAKGCKDYAAASKLSDDERIVFYKLAIKEFTAALSELEPEPTGTDGGSNTSVAPESIGGHAKTQTAASAHFSLPRPVATVENAEQKCNVHQFRPDNIVLPDLPETTPERDAELLIDAFESVGARQFKTVFISCVTLAKDYRCLNGEDVAGAEVRARIPGYIRRSERQSQSVCLRPMNPELRQSEKVCTNGALIQIDDCSAEVLEQLEPYSFVTVETSPANFQAWVALPVGTTEGERVAVRERLLRRLKETGANGGAFNSVRLAGSLNAKEKYRGADGKLPRVRLARVARGLLIAPSELEAAGLLAASLPPKVRQIKPYSNPRIPLSEADYSYYLARSGSSAKAFDRSNADICYAMAMLRMGHLEHDIESRINDLSDKARGRNDNYAEKTVKRARDFVAEDCRPRRARREQIAI